MSAAGYRWLEHTSELELQIDAASEQEVFGLALEALGELVGDEQQEASTGPPQGRCEGGEKLLERTITVAADDRGALLAAFLEELVYLIEAEDLLPERIGRFKLDRRRLHAVIHGRRGSPRQLVKGVTYHDLSFAPAGDGFTATVVLDV